MKKKTSDHLTAEQKVEIEALAAFLEDQIKTDDIPEVQDWSGATHGIFYPKVSSHGAKNNVGDR